MANPIILRVCESCHEYANATGGLRNIHGSLFCARCTLVVEIVAHLGHQALQVDGPEAAEDLSKFCTGAMRSYIDRADPDAPQAQIAILFADN